jgi:hypothetical protein
MFQPLTDEERDTLNRAGTSLSERSRLYAKRLYFTAQSYAIAADAVGLRKDAAKYLYAESLRLHREAGIAADLADVYASRGK